VKWNAGLIAQIEPEYTLMSATRGSMAPSVMARAKFDACALQGAYGDYRDIVLLFTGYRIDDSFYQSLGAGTVVRLNRS